MFSGEMSGIGSLVGSEDKFSLVNAVEKYVVV